MRRNDHDGLDLQVVRNFAANWTRDPLLGFHLRPQPLKVLGLQGPGLVREVFGHSRSCLPTYFWKERDQIHQYVMVSFSNFSNGAWGRTG